MLMDNWYLENSYAIGFFNLHIWKFFYTHKCSSYLEVLNILRKQKYYRLADSKSAKVFYIGGYK